MGSLKTVTASCINRISASASKKASVDSTPSIYLNGRKYSLGLSVESLSLAVDDELDWMTGNSAWPSN